MRQAIKSPPAGLLLAVSFGAGRLVLNVGCSPLLFAAGLPNRSPRGSPGVIGKVAQATDSTG